MKPEVYFLRYAFPCARVLVDIRKTITEEEFEKLEQAVKTDTPIDRSYLEKIFIKAVEGMKKISNDIWNIETIRKYFQEGHENSISKDLPSMIQRLCKIKKGILIDKKKGVFIAELENEKRNIIPLYKNPEIGDKVIIHYGYAVEKLS
ncbi:MAG: hypothetical protein V3V78_02820 [Candidatus Woesearchaeota archaeon]